jgi:hypothetical protein
MTASFPDFEAQVFGYFDTLEAMQPSAKAKASDPVTPEAPAVPVHEPKP